MSSPKLLSLLRILLICMIRFSFCPHCLCTAYHSVLCSSEEIRMPQFDATHLPPLMKIWQNWFCWDCIEIAFVIWLIFAAHNYTQERLWLQIPSRFIKFSLGCYSRYPSIRLDHLLFFFFNYATLSLASCSEHSDALAAITSNLVSKLG